MPMDEARQPARERGMTPGQAKTVEQAIVAMSITALIFLFQPLSLPFYSLGAGVVVFAGLAFNLVPLCTPGRPVSSLIKGAIVILLIFAVITLLALGSAKLYAVYMASGQ
jgi:hypothetical protein